MISKIKRDPRMDPSYPGGLVGLCTDCHHAANCVVKNPGSVIFNCEEYDPFLGKQKQEIQKPHLPFSSKAAGLCSSCDNVADCALRNPESIIFNCEHYL